MRYHGDGGAVCKPSTTRWSQMFSVCYSHWNNVLGYLFILFISHSFRSDSSKMSSASTEVMSRQRRLQNALLLHLHLLANPGDSLLLQQTLDQLLRWLCPSLRIFHVSERASPYRSYTRLCPVAGYPSVAITFFLHEAYGEERILKVLDFFQHPPWQYHHTESCGSRTGGVHISSSSSSANAFQRPYLLPSRDFYSLGEGMPVWGVRPVHCGGEILRVTLYSSYDNYEDSVRLYETVLQRQAEEQKTGFCWFTLHTEPGLCLQLAIKQLSPGVRVEPCNSAVLQFNVEEIGQLVPLLPNPCAPISPMRWQTEDLEGNKVLFQVKTPVQPQRPLTCAFPLSGPAVSPRGLQLGSLSPSRFNSALSWHNHRLVGHKGRNSDGRADSFGSGSGCSSPPSSSCYSSQRSSPAPAPPSHQTESPMRTLITRSMSHLLLEEEEEEEETNVDTGAMVSPPCDIVHAAIRRSSSVDLLMSVNSERPAAVGASAAEVLAKELRECLPRTFSRTTDTGHSSSNGTNGTSPEPRTTLRSLKTNGEDMDEFYI
uniref:Family with sequence similarity 124B n=1 Tax=Neogobius melanostomus TaxID=47308 RepID=A0A8C6U494_9GOBI